MTCQNRHRSPKKSARAALAQTLVQTLVPVALLLTTAVSCTSDSAEKDGASPAVGGSAASRDPSENATDPLNNIQNAERTNASNPVLTPNDTLANASAGGGTGGLNGGSSNLPMNTGGGTAVAGELDPNGDREMSAGKKKTATSYTEDGLAIPENGGSSAPLPTLAPLAQATPPPPPPPPAAVPPVGGLPEAGTAQAPAEVGLPGNGGVPPVANAGASAGAASQISPPPPPESAPPSPEAVPPPPAAGDAGASSPVAVAREHAEKGRWKRELSADELQAAKAAAARLQDLAAGAGPESYVVQPGDTLWDISDQLLDDPYWWPKLWSLNPNVKNPNLIFPGMELDFYPSPGTEAPSIALKDKVAEAIPIEAANLTSVLAVPSTLEDAWRDHDGEIVDPNEIPKDTTIDTIPSPEVNTVQQVRLPGFIAAQAPEALGEIIELDSSPMLAGEEVYADFLTDAAPGSRFLTVRRIENIEDVNGDLPIAGDYWVYTGTIGVAKKNANGVYTIVVEDTRHGVMAGDKIIPFRNLYKTVNVDEPGKPSPIQATVIATQDADTALAMEYEIVYFNRPPGASISEGDDVDIYMPPGGIMFFNSDKLDGKLIGRARVLEVTEDSFIAYVTKNNREVAIGARTWPDFNDD